MHTTAPALTILDSPVAELAQTMMVSDIRALAELVEQEGKALNRRKETLAALLARRFETKAKEALVAAGKDTGTVHVEMNGVTINVEFPKEVKYDQPKIMAILNAMKPEDAQHYAKLEVKIDERKYTAAPPAIQAAIAPARTVKVGKPKYSFKLTAEEAA